MTDGIVLSPIAGVAAIMIGLPVVMALVALILRYTSGWNRLEQLYLDRTTMFSGLFGLTSFQMASPIFNSFRNIFLIGVADKGLLLKALPGLGLIFRPILIPWDEFRLGGQEFLGINRNELFLSRFPEIQIILTDSTRDRLQETIEARDRSSA